MTTIEQAPSHSQLHEAFNKSDFVNVNDPRSKVGLGQLAVDSDISTAEYYIGQGASAGDFGKRLQVSRIDIGIADVGDLSRYGKYHFNKNVRKKNPPEHLIRMIGAKGLVGKNYAKMITTSDNKDAVLNFMQWHNFELAKDQKTLDEMSHIHKELYREKMNKAIEKGWVPEWVGDRIDERLLDTIIIQDDGFNTLFDKSPAAGKAYRAYDKEYIKIAPSPLSKGQTEKVMTHEFNHVMDGFTKGEGRQGVYGMYRLFGSPHTYAGFTLNEAVVEHLADALHKGNSIDVIDVAARQRQNAVYTTERKLLNVLATKGEMKIDIRDFIAAHFDQGEYIDENGDTPTEKLKRKLKEAFPTRDIVGELNQCQNEKDIKRFTRKLRREYKGILPSKHEVMKGATYGAVALSAFAGMYAVEDLINDQSQQASYQDVQPQYLQSDGTYLDAPDWDSPFLSNDSAVFDNNYIYGPDGEGGQSMANSIEIVESQGGVIEGDRYYFPEIAPNDSVTVEYDQSNGTFLQSNEDDSGGIQEHANMHEPPSTGK